MIRRLLPFVSCYLLLAACTVTKTDLRLDQMEMAGLAEAEVADDVAALRTRVEGLWSNLEHAKLTTHLTKGRITEYFETEKDQSDFIAIYATLFREKRFAREYVEDFEIGKIVIEPNGVLARVEVKIWGKIYAIWRHRIHEVQLWKKVGGVWLMQPVTY